MSGSRLRVIFGGSAGLVVGDDVVVVLTLWVVINWVSGEREKK